jgi:hypothetical protein
MKDKTKIYVGLILCVVGVTLGMEYFPFLKVLIIIPLLLFIISIFIKYRLISILINSLFILQFLVFFIGNTLPTSGEIIIESRIRYQVIDIGQGDFIKNRIEYKQQNRRVFLQDTIDGIQWLYVDSADFKKLWPEPPFKMKEKKYTIKAKFKTYRLLNGNYAKSILLEYKRIRETPLITK